MTMLLRESEYLSTLGSTLHQDIQVRPPQAVHQGSGGRCSWCTMVSRCSGLGPAWCRPPSLQQSARSSLQVTWSTSYCSPAICHLPPATCHLHHLSPDS